MSDKALKNIFLNKFHLENGAKFVPFAGYEMPINYKKGIINEHLHVREKAGIFDVSHMGQILIPSTDKNISLPSLVIVIIPILIAWFFCCPGAGMNRFPNPGGNK